MSQPQTTASFCALQKPTSHTIQARAQQNYHPSPGKRLTDEWCTMETNQLGSWSGHRQQTQPFTPSLYNAKIMFVVGSKNLPTTSLPTMCTETTAWSYWNCPFWAPARQPPNTQNRKDLTSNATVMHTVFQQSQYVYNNDMQRVCAVSIAHTAFGDIIYGRHLARIKDSQSAYLDNSSSCDTHTNDEQNKKSTSRVGYESP